MGTGPSSLLAAALGKKDFSGKLGDPRQSDPGPGSSLTWKEWDALATCTLNVGASAHESSWPPQPLQIHRVFTDMYKRMVTKGHKRIYLEDSLRKTSVNLSKLTDFLKMWHYVSLQEHI